MPLFFFSCAWVIGIYLFNSAIARRFTSVEIKTALCYASSVIVLGVFGEVLVDSIYNKLFDAPLWIYQVFPIHHSYTSEYSLFIWGMYGFHLYLLHRSFGRKIHSTWVLATIVSVEALILEILFNLTSLLFLGRYIFYYLPTDLWHVTSIQVMPVYFLAGFLITRLTKDERVDPWFFILTNLCLTVVLIFLAR